MSDAQAVGTRHHSNPLLRHKDDIHGSFFTADSFSAQRLPYHPCYHTIPPPRFSLGEARTNTDYIQSAA